MKLYTDNQGRWAGTQADAKKFGEFEQVEVPTDKPTLLEFINDHKVCTTEEEPIEQKVRISPIDGVNLKAAFDSAGLTRGYLRRVFDKLEGSKNEDSGS